MDGSRRLVQGNDTCMFATVLCGRIDVRSGELWLASAGHETPLLLRAEVLELRTSRSRPGVGIAKFRYAAAREADGALVLDALITQFLRR